MTTFHSSSKPEKVLVNLPSIYIKANNLQPWTNLRYPKGALTQFTSSTRGMPTFETFNVTNVFNFSQPVNQISGQASGNLAVQLKIRNSLTNFQVGCQATSKFLGSFKFLFASQKLFGCALEMSPGIKISILLALQRFHQWTSWA